MSKATMYRDRAISKIKSNRHTFNLNEQETHRNNTLAVTCVTCGRSLIFSTDDSDYTGSAVTSKCQ